MTKKSRAPGQAIPGASKLNDSWQQAVFDGDFNMIPCEDSSPQAGNGPNGAKRLLVAALSAVFEASPLVARFLGFAVLACWPTFREA